MGMNVADCREEYKEFTIPLRILALRHSPYLEQNAEVNKKKLLLCFVCFL
jgi:hypothetical protein